MEDSSSLNEQEELKNALRYEFAKCCFLDIADYDYIAARTLYRNCCYHQSFILMQQAVEKYLKAILLYNKIPASNALHKINELLIKCQGDVQWFKLSDTIINFIKELDGMEHSRYLTFTTFGFFEWLHILDESVWQLRVFAQSDTAYNKDGIRQMMTDGLDKYIGTEIIFNGNLEKIMAGHTQNIMELRANLMWQNLYYFDKEEKQTINKLNFLGGLPFQSLFDTYNLQTKKLLYEAVKGLICIPKELRKNLERL